MGDLDPVEEIIPLFGYAHLPPHLRAVSQPFGELAAQLAATLPHNRELTKALDRLLEAKDAAVRALVAK
jgi:hypothetical protein